MESANTTNQDLSYCFTDPLDLKSGRTLITDYILKYEHPQPLHCETHTHTQKNGENLPVFENYDCLQHRNHLHR